MIKDLLGKHPCPAPFSILSESDATNFLFASGPVKAKPQHRPSCVCKAVWLTCWLVDMGCWYSQSSPVQSSVGLSLNMLVQNLTVVVWGVFEFLAPVLVSCLFSRLLPRKKHSVCWHLWCTLYTFGSLQRYRESSAVFGPTPRCLWSQGATSERKDASSCLPGRGHVSEGKQWWSLRLTVWSLKTECILLCNDLLYIFWARRLPDFRWCFF